MDIYIQSGVCTCKYGVSKGVCVHNYVVCVCVLMCVCMCVLCMFTAKATGFDVSLVADTE